MSVLVIFIAGVPASGKSTIMRKILPNSYTELRYGRLRGRINGQRVYLGVYGNTPFDGTDKLPMDVISDAITYIKTLENSELRYVVFLEGDRLFCKRFIDSVGPKLYVIDAPEDVLNVRHRARGDFQSEQFLKSRRTKVENLVKEYSIEKHQNCTDKDSNDILNSIKYDAEQYEKFGVVTPTNKIEKKETKLEEHKMKDYSSPRWTTELVDCSMPMTFDTYSNCSFGCLYCFSQYRRAIGNSKDAYLNKEVSAVNVDRIKRMFTDPDTHGGQFAEYIKQRKVMQWGGLSDQFDGFERKHGRTLELLRFFKEIDYPLCFSTKAVFFTHDEAYMELIRGQKNWNFKFSIITPDERKARIIERGVPSPAERLKAIERIAEADAGGATLRLRPFVLGISTPGYLDLIQQAHDAGATAVSTEFLCIERRSLSLRKVMPIINELCGFDLYDFYIKHSPGAGYLRLSETVKRPFYANMKELCDKIGMRFYVSDAHWKELCCNGSCCGLGTEWNYSRGQFCEALQIAKKNGVVHWSDIAGPNAEIFSKVNYIGAQGLNTIGSENRAKFDGMTLTDYMHYLWNTPKAGSSPYKLFFGVIEPCGHDENGDIIYKYKGR